MGDLARDTELHGRDGRYQATLREDWRIWGPNGGYVAAIALRAAGAVTRFRRPVSFQCHFLGVGAFAPAEVAVAPLRSARTAESLRVTLAQDGRPLLDAQVWTSDAREGLRHDFAPPPEVAKPEALRSYEELLAGLETGPRHRFWDNLEGRPTDWVAPSEWRPGAPRLCCWYRFRPTARSTIPSSRPPAR